MSDTVFALSTAPGKAGVAVVRVSGPKASESYRVLTGKKHLSPPRQTSLIKLIDPAGDIIDEAMTILFKGPESFTGEDVAEYHLHGSPAVISSLLSELSKQPFHRMAEPGEFTRRAFENGKLDLTEAEAIGDLIAAETQMQKQQALSQMGGALYRLYEGWRTELVRALAYVEAIIDFPDEEIPDSETSKARPAIEKLLTEISAHLNDNRRGERLREGIHVAVIGAPNAGKSSLVNVLAQRDVAIVSPLPGTTRDVIEVHLDLGGYPVILSDTAGLRPDQISNEGQESIESEGIRRALNRAREADIKLLVFDGTQSVPDKHTQALIDDSSIIVINKSDLLKSEGRKPAVEGSTQIPPRAALGRDDSIILSVSTGAGFDELLSALTQKIKSIFDVARETPSLTRARHRNALEECSARLTSSLCANNPELMAEDLRLAARGLGRITGRVDVEDLLDVIFRDFCIGK